MNRILRYTFICLILISGLLSAQVRKEVQLNKTTESISIDGVLNESVWSNATPMQDFVMFRPDAKLKEPEDKKTVVKAVYTNEAIYFGAILYDNDMEGIQKQMMNRDEFGNTDFFGVILNPSNDQQNDFEFFVQFTGAQCDAFSNPNIGEDFSWNAVWKSKVTYHDTHWIVEMKIPYSTLRFANNKIQDWGLNLHRNFRNTRAQYTWNFIDRTVGNIGQYHGIIKGLEDLKPPVRLSLFPYLSSYYLSNADKKFETKIGMDIKYGLSENFTLDATLVPDFGQTGFDNEALNLGPFEQRFTERRAFFTENIELFNKGDLFYSRRIGGRPIDASNIDLSDDEVISYNPESVETINALKISGRTKNGLGIGFFNAITDRSIAEITNETTNTNRDVVTNPRSLYNVLVLEQQLKRNSTLSYINTSVIREGSFKDANVSSLRLNYFTDKNRFRWKAFSNFSHTEGDKSLNGFVGDIRFSKVSGEFRYSLGTNVYSDHYDVNDVGIYFGNNTQSVFGDVELYEFKPKKNRLNSRIGLYYRLNYLYKPRTYTGNNIEVNGHLNTKKFLTIGGGIGTKIGDQFDYFEPRTTGRYFRTGGEFFSNVFISTDYRKTFALDLRVNVGQQHAPDRNPHYYQTVIAPRFNVNEHLTLVFRTDIFKNLDDAGYVADNGDQIIFGKRDRFTIQNSIEGNYRFSANHGIRLAFRNYWSSAKYGDNNYYELLHDGRLQSISHVFDEDDNPNRNFTTWNMDVSYNWNFAPGSELIFLYRNQLKQSGTNIEDGYFTTLDQLLNRALNHTLSLRLVYYLDYHTIKNKWFKRQGLS
ncbi:MAG: DUF5916 domain-containing protein [Flavobacteriales bacterium]